MNDEPLSFKNSLNKNIQEEEQNSLIEEIIESHTTKSIILNHGVKKEEFKKPIFEKKGLIEKSTFSRRMIEINNNQLQIKKSIANHKDEIDEIVSQTKNKKKVKIGSKSPLDFENNEKGDLKSITLPIIKRNKYDDKATITVSETILWILELCLNSKIYIEKMYGNKSKIFWTQLEKNKELKFLFENYRPETLKKYWIMICGIKNLAELIELVKQHENEINQISKYLFF
jgi:hypothetical protein